MEIRTNNTLFYSRFCFHGHYNYLISPVFMSLAHIQLHISFGSGSDLFNITSIVHLNHQFWLIKFNAMLL